jgi:hypothetical protein
MDFKDQLSSSAETTMDPEIDTSRPPVGIPIVEVQAIPVNFYSSEFSRGRPSLDVHPVVHSSCILNRDQTNKLKDLGFPYGLAQELGNTRMMYPVRFWVVDNSGSMRANDGHQLRGSTQGQLRVVQCNRWTELQEAVEFHATLASLLDATTVCITLHYVGSHKDAFLE